VAHGAGTNEKRRGHDKTPSDFVKDAMEAVDHIRLVVTAVTSQKVLENTHLVIVPDELKTGNASKDYNWSEVRSGYVKIFGRVAWDWYMKGEKFYYTGILPWYDGQSELFMCSKDGVFGFVRNNDMDQFTIMPQICDRSILTHDERVKNCMEGCVSKWFTMTGVNVPEFKRYVRKAWRTFGEDFTGFEMALDKYIASQWWMDLCESYIASKRETWLQLHKLFVEDYLAGRGYSAAQAEHYLKMKTFWKKVRYWITPTNWLCECITGPVPEFRVDVMNDILDKTQHSRRPPFVPFARIGVYRQEFGDDRTLPDVRKNVTIAYEPDLIQRLPYDDEKVDVYGTTLDVPWVLPVVNATTTHAAVRMRMSGEHPVDKAVEAAFYKYAIEMIDQMEDIYLEPYDRQEFLKKAYPGAKGDTLYEASKEVLQKKHLVCTLFSKDEAYIGKTPENFKPRMIWSRNDVVVGKFAGDFRQIGESLKRQFNRSSSVYYTCSSSPWHVGMYAKTMDTRYTTKREADISSMDGSLTDVFMRLERYFMDNKVYGRNEEMDFLITHWRYTKGITSDGSLEVELDYGRRSGDLWTSMFNSLLNVLITLFAHDLKWDDDFMMLVLGDDSVFACPDLEDDDVVVETFAGVGLKVAIKDNDDMRNVAYCSGWFADLRGGFKYTNNVWKTFTKLGINYRGHSPKHYRKLLHGIALSMLPTAGHAPILGAFLKAIVETAEENNIGIMKDNRHMNPYRIQGGSVDDPDIATYEQFAVMHGCSTYTLAELEEWINCNVSIMDCPYILGEQFLDMWESEQQVPAIPNPNLSFSDQYKFVTEIAPRYEERMKLCRVNSMSAAIRSGWAWGMCEQEEMELADDSHHEFWHAFFSAVSYMNFDWGVALHGRANATRFLRGQDLFTRRKPKPKGKNVPPRRARPKRRNPVPKARPSRGLGNAMSGLAGLGGGAIGGYFGGPAGALMGKTIGSNLGQIIFGGGDYKITKNSLAAGKAFIANPNFLYSSREYLGEVQGTVAFTATSFPLNPGLSQIMPRGSRIARMFAKCVPRGVYFEFISTSGNALNSTNTALGSVLMATQYDVTQPQFVNKAQMANYTYTNSCSPAESMRHYIECDASNRQFEVMMVRTGDVIDSGAAAAAAVGSLLSDRRLYDFATFVLATSGMQATSTIGEIWIGYDWEFIDPRVSSNVSTGDFCSASLTTAPYTNALPLNTTLSGLLAGPLDGISLNGTAIVFDDSITSGTFEIVLCWRGASTAVTLANPTYTNCAVATGSNWNVDGTNPTLYSPATGATTATVLWVGFVVISGYSPTGSLVDFGAAMTLPATGTGIGLTIEALPTNETTF